MYSDPVTYRKILRVLVIGFSAVIALLMAAGFIGLKSAQLIQENSAEIVHNGLVTTRLIDELQREQDTLNAAFYKLSRGPELSERERLLAQLDEADQAVERIVAEAAGTPQAELWRQLSTAVQGFSSEARRLLVRKNVPTYTSRDLLRHHEEVTAIVAKMIANNYTRTLAAQSRMDQRSAQLVTESLGLLGGCLLLALVCAIFTVRITTQLFRRMEQQSSDLARVTWHMLESQETAARRFSHELHDELGQSLTAIKANVTALDPATPPDPARLEDCRRLIDEAIQNVRELSHLLRPTILDDFGLDAGIRWLSERFGQRTGIEVDYQSSFHERLADQTETHLFRIVQEALTNVAQAFRRHARRDRAGAQREPGASHGEGQWPRVSTERSHPGLGLVGMRARAQSVGGELRNQVRTMASRLTCGRHLRGYKLNMLRILLADDHAMVRKGFRLILEAQPDMQIVGEAGNGREAVELAEQLHPDVVVMDVAMPELNGIEATRRLIASAPRTRVLALSMHKDSVYVREILRAGARGYLLKDSIDSDLVNAVRAVAKGEGYLSPGVSDAVLSDYRKHVTDPLDLLTSREREVLQMIAEGKTNKEIAGALNLSVYTVDAHRGKIMEKLNLHSIGEMVRFAVRNGLID